MNYLIYIYTHSTLKNFIWTKSLKLIKQPCDSPYYMNWGFSLPVNFLSSPITFFLFFFSFGDIYGFTVGLSHTFTILYQLMFFSAGQLLIFTNNFFFFSLGYIRFFSVVPPPPFFFLLNQHFLRIVKLW